MLAKFGKSGNFGKISPFRRTCSCNGDMSRNAGSDENGDFGKISPRLHGKFGKSGDFGKISPRLSTK